MLTDTQKVIIVIARWRNLNVLQATSLAVAESERSTTATEVVEYFRSDECLNRVAALQETFGDAK